MARGAAALASCLARTPARALFLSYLLSLPAAPAIITFATIGFRPGMALGRQGLCFLTGLAGTDLLTGLELLAAAVLAERLSSGER